MDAGTGAAASRTPGVQRLGFGRELLLRLGKLLTLMKRHFQGIVSSRLRML